MLRTLRPATIRQRRRTTGAPVGVMPDASYGTPPKPESSAAYADA
ncbi:MAG TPA: hypothetical protein VK358_02550 [Longimicrobium sp.]|nr:hypothetical protein [Longimicrobium sp.]